MVLRRDRHLLTDGRAPQPVGAVATAVESNGRVPVARQGALDPPGGG